MYFLNIGMRHASFLIATICALPIFGMNDSTSLKKKIFTLTMGNAFMLPNRDEFHFIYLPRAPHDNYYNCIVTEKATFFNPGLKFGYLQRLAFAAPNRNKVSHALYLGIELGWNSNRNKKVMIGEMTNDYLSSYFKGTITQNNKFDYLSLKPNIRFSLLNHRTTMYSLGFGIARHRILIHRSQTEYHDEATSRNWVHKGKFDARDSPRLNMNTNEEFFHKYDYFSASGNITVQRTILRKVFGVSLEYSISEYEIYAKPYEYKYDSSYLKNFNHCTLSFCVNL